MISSGFKILAPFALLIIFVSCVGNAAARAHIDEAPLSVPLRLSVAQALSKRLGIPLQEETVVRPLEQTEVWAFGTAAIPAPAREGATPLATLFIARRDTTGWEVALRPDDAFTVFAHQTPLTIPETARRPAQPGLAGDGSAQLGLPFPVGETWTLAGGPHASGFIAEDIWSAIDLSNDAGSNGSGVIVAAREGTAYTPCSNLVVIYHDDGWVSNYYHVAGITINNGQRVARGTPLGMISREAICGGGAAGPHVHFWVSLSDRYAEVPIHGLAIGGWTVENGESPYGGCMVKGDNRQCEPSGLISNDGAIGAAPTELLLRNPSFETSGGPQHWQWDGPCNYLVIDTAAGARDGTNFVATNRGGNSACTSFYQDVTYTPAVGEQITFAIWARSLAGAPLYGGITLWSRGAEDHNTSVPFRLSGLSWQCYEVTLTVPAPATSLRPQIYLHSLDESDYYFDNAMLARGAGPLCPLDHRYRVVLINQPSYQMTMTPGSEQTVELRVRNAGSAPWDAETSLATLPRNESSPFYHESWSADGRIATTSAVAADESKLFRFIIRAPQKPETYDLTLTMLQEYVVWFAEPASGPIRLRITVTDTPPTYRSFLPLLRR